LQGFKKEQDTKNGGTDFNDGSGIIFRDILINFPMNKDRN
jgi:hypothetical protein